MFFHRPIPRDWLQLAGLVLLLRLLLFFWGALQFDFAAHPEADIFSIWSRWDAENYLRIASHGYSAIGLTPEHHRFLSHFPPFYPILIAALGFFGVPPLAAALGISLLAGVCASLAIFELVKTEFKDRPAAFRAALFLNIFPTAYFLQAPYSDSLYLLFSILAFLFLRCRNAWYRGCFSALGAILSRLVGVTILPALCVDFFLRVRRKEVRPAQWPFFFAICGSPLWYLAVNFIAYGDPLFFLKDSREQYHVIKIGFIPFKESLSVLRALFTRFPELSGDTGFMMAQGWNALLLLSGAVGTLLFSRRLPLLYTLYSATYLLLISSMTWAISNARYMLALFPLFIGQALISQPLLRRALIILQLGLLLYFTRAYVRGGWAF